MSKLLDRALDSFFSDTSMVMLWAVGGVVIIAGLVFSVNWVVQGGAGWHPVEHVYESGVRCYTWASSVSCVK